jgi:hypothetical protein
MALPSSGQISFSDINTELGQSSDAQLSLSDAVQGNVVAINTNSENIPDESPPHPISQWYGYDHSAGGGLTEFNAGGSFFFSFEACEVGDNGGTFYHNGGGSLPTYGDGVFVDDAGEVLADPGYYFVNTSYVFQVDDSGTVSDVTACGG